MANANLPKGFELIHPKDALCLDFLIADADALSAGDVVYLDSSGYASDTQSKIVLGIAQDNMRRGTTGAYIPVATTSSTTYYDYISVCVDVNAIYRAQISTGALADPYTTRSSAACFDETGDSGSQYINAATHALDQWKILGAANEDKDGVASAIGVYRKVYCKLNIAVCAFGTIA